MSDWMPEPGTRPEAAPDPAAPGAADPGPAPSHEPAPPAPLGVPRTPTGYAGVDARLERLADADHLPADGHGEVYEDVHRGLRDELTALDARPAPVSDAQ
ncbi:hypothetical protein [Streptomyces halstedii]|uniref:Uncharacterized protein n=1 Tax=Streptomyces halstedii TaxID=1944 RepID=A0A6N9U6W3_STRHA|nr:hypothetical protein [Streptomyces halstedii]MBV7674066.1 hypothetical protein [Streptomyces halstedii]NEA17783.1 hypothetical protein [Streptomyces halstedii]